MNLNPKPETKNTLMQSDSLRPKKVASYTSKPQPPDPIFGGYNPGAGKMFDMFLLNTGC